ncbi:MAG: CopG family transcriptional regulator [Desulfuromonadales bacterium GWD2_61_12]|nr:MAG: CopG family transcriptional regulator [Desulfuromonadales bacterium GWC2_61_20]OGR36622.1 MAG: CopG family transcriptional regulator [Desulfuromonadales bacterium GWD2_61_12]HBT82468.1 toxin-antitoxin system HicB family antitoxin [Desulfuromonas sp.]
MSTISVRLPDSIHKMAKEVASEDHISLNQFIASAVAEKLSALTTETYLAGRAARGSVEKFHAALDKVPAVEPDEFDRI